MTSGAKTLSIIAVLAALLWVILGLVGWSQGSNAFATDADLATAVALKAVAGSCFSVMFVCIVGLCIISAVREMLGWQPPSEQPEGLLSKPVVAPGEKAE